LVLTACTFKEFKGGGLADIPQLTSSCLDCGVIIWSMQVLQFLGPSLGLNSEPHLGDDEAVIRPTIGIADRLGYQHVLSISPPDENIVQQLPAPRPRVHPRGLLPRRKVEEGVGQQETVPRPRLQKKEAVIVTAMETVGTQHSLPGSVVRPDLGVEVTKDN
uniref:Mediator of RNA polymerase II transcription subunit 13 n=1 Tax=Schistocephalus solidus TaxID=70667 RepID=A0A183TPC8_SCHSO